MTHLSDGQEASECLLLLILQQKHTGVKGYLYYNIQGVKGYL